MFDTPLPYWYSKHSPILLLPVPHCDLFAVTAVCSIMANLLFVGEFAADKGETVDNFLDSFISLFVYLSSLENFDLVYQGYRYSGVTWVFFIPIALVGVFFLTSMVIGQFELSYTKYKSLMTYQRNLQNRFAFAVAFALSTDSDLDSEAFISMMTQYWQKRGIELNTIIEQTAHMQGIAEPDQNLAAHAFTGPIRAVAFMVFDIADSDNSLSISFGEFPVVVGVSECVSIVNSNPSECAQCLATGFVVNRCWCASYCM